jgi:hypothetical protein
MELDELAKLHRISHDDEEFEEWYSDDFKICETMEGQRENLVYWVPSFPNIFSKLAPKWKD